jgi:hypothetical protein
VRKPLSGSTSWVQRGTEQHRTVLQTVYLPDHGGQLELYSEEKVLRTLCKDDPTFVGAPLARDARLGTGADTDFADESADADACIRQALTLEASASRCFTRHLKHCTKDLPRSSGREHPLRLHTLSIR